MAYNLSQIIQSLGLGVGKSQQLGIPKKGTLTPGRNRAWIDYLATQAGIDPATLEGWGSASGAASAGAEKPFNLTANRMDRANGRALDRGRILIGGKPQDRKRPL